LLRVIIVVNRLGGRSYAPRWVPILCSTWLFVLEVKLS